MKAKNKKTVIWIVAITIILIGGILIVKNAEKRDASASVAKSYAMVVSTMHPFKQDISLTLPYLAVAQNDRDVNLASKIAARIEYIKPSGLNVKKGEIIAKLDNTSILSNKKSVQAQYKAINTSLKNMLASHNRTLELVKVQGASIEQSNNEESKIAELNSKKESLHQKLNELNNMLSYATILSPVNGNISKTMVNPGDMAMPGHPIANIRAKNGYYLLVRVPTDLKISAVVLNEIRHDAIALNSTFNGLAEYKVYMEGSNMMTGNRIELSVEVFKGNAILLPYDAVLNRNGKSFVLLREDRHAKAQEVNIIQSGEQGIAISNDNLEGKEIVVEKQDILLKLLSGISLKIKEE